MLAFPHECRRNYNCAEVEKVAVNSNIPTYQFAIIKLAVKLSMERKLEIKYQLAVPFPGKLFFSWNHFSFVIINLRLIYVILYHLSDTKAEVFYYINYGLSIIMSKLSNEINDITKIVNFGILIHVLS